MQNNDTIFTLFTSTAIVLKFLEQKRLNQQITGNGKYDTVTTARNVKYSNLGDFIKVLTLQLHAQHTANPTVVSTTRYLSYKHHIHLSICWWIVITIGENGHITE